MQMILKIIQQMTMKNNVNVSGENLLDTLIKLLAEQEGVKISYTTERTEKNAS